MSEAKTSKSISNLLNFLLIVVALGAWLAQAMPNFSAYISSACAILVVTIVSAISYYDRGRSSEKNESSSLVADDNSEVTTAKFENAEFSALDLDRADDLNHKIGSILKEFQVEANFFSNLPAKSNFWISNFFYQQSHCSFKKDLSALVAQSESYEVQIGVVTVSVRGSDVSIRISDSKRLANPSTSSGEKIDVYLVPDADPKSLIGHGN